MGDELHSADRFLAQLKFHGYGFNRINFESNPDYDGGEVHVEFRIGHRTELKPSDHMAEVILTCTAFPEPADNNYPFTISTEMTGLFEYDAELDDELRDTFINTNALAIMFPYIRSAISTVTASAGAPPLTLQPINIAEYVRQQQEAQQTDEDGE